MIFLIDYLFHFAQTGYLPSMSVIRKIIRKPAQTHKEWFLLMQGNNRPLQSPDTLIMRFSAPLQTRYDNQTGGII